MSGDRWPGLRLRVGPFGFHVRSPLPSVIDQVGTLYADYPRVSDNDVVDYMVALRPASLLRRVFRPKMILECDVEVPMMAPQPLEHAVLAIEMGMNLQIAAGMQRYLLLHAGAVERDGGGLILSGDSGSGKSTLSAILGHRGWRFLGDEFAMIEPATRRLIPFPRPISLKNQSIPLLEAIAPAGRFGPRMEGTLKGTVRHLAPPADAIARMGETAAPRLLIVPNFTLGVEAGARPLDRLEVFAQLTQSSTNYWKLGEAGFDAAWALTETIPGYEIVYSSAEDAIGLLDTLWSMHG